jgi:hypothetical protein
MTRVLPSKLHAGYREPRPVCIYRPAKPNVYVSGL